MKKGIMLSIVLLGCCAAQGIQENKTTDIKKYIEKATEWTKGSGTTEGREHTKGHPISNLADLLVRGKLPEKEYFTVKTPEYYRRKMWWEGLQSLEHMLGEKTLYLGVPLDKQATTPTFGWSLVNYLFGNYNRLAKQYSLLRGFGDTNDALNNNHYELYLMPGDHVFYEVINGLKNGIEDFYTNVYKSHLKDDIAFIAVRPTPNVTSAPYNNQPMPRIIVGFKSGADKQRIQDLFYFIDAKLNTVLHSAKGRSDHHKQEAYEKFYTWFPLAPRYSEQFKTSPLYWAYGSADFKDSTEGRRQYKNAPSKAYLNDKEKLFVPNTKSEDKYPEWMPSEHLQQIMNKK